MPRSYFSFAFTLLMWSVELSEDYESVIEEQDVSVIVSNLKPPVSMYLRDNFIPIPNLDVVNVFAVFAKTIASAMTVNFNTA